MKRFLLIMATATLLLICISSAEAWEVKIKNSCDSDVEIFVYGQHLFFDNQIDCTVNVAKGTTGTCQMPGGICPSKISGRYWKREFNPIFCTDTGGYQTATCCWNVNVEVTRWADTCRVELR